MNSWVLCSATPRFLEKIANRSFKYLAVFREVPPPRYKNLNCKLKNWLIAPPNILGAFLFSDDWDEGPRSPARRSFSAGGHFPTFFVGKSSMENEDCRVKNATWEVQNEKPNLNPSRRIRAGWNPDVAHRDLPRYIYGAESFQIWHFLF